MRISQQQQINHSKYHSQYINPKLSITFYMFDNRLEFCRVELFNHLQIPFPHEHNHATISKYYRYKLDVPWVLC